MDMKYNIMERKSKSCSIIWACLLVYISTPATTVHATIGCINCETNSDNRTVDSYDPCSRDILRTTVHGVASVSGSCDASGVIIDEITDKIVRSVPELNSHDYLVIVCPTTAATSNTCLYSICITESKNNVMVTNDRLTRLSLAALQSTFTTITMLEQDGDGKGLRKVRAASDDGSGSGDMGGSGDVGGSGDIGGSGSMGSPTSPPTNADQSSDLSGLEEWHIGAISFGAISLLFCCMFTLMIFYFMHKRRLRAHSSQGSFPITFDDGDLELHPISPQMPKKISRFSLRQFTSPVLTNLLDINSLKQMLHNYNRIEEEYSKLPRNMITVEHIPEGAVYKNRYIDILPNPRTRVALYLQSGVSNSDYINANCIRGYKLSSKQYIATQGPLPTTIEDFWRLVWEQRCSAIVMLTNLVEGGKEKCCRYWPDERVNGTLVSGDLIITLAKVQTRDNYLMTTLHVQHKDKAVSREITHFWLMSWPDHGVPDSVIPVIAFIREVRNHQREIPGPLLVHCSAGIGRTGVFIASDIGMRHLEEDNKVDILRIVSTLRQDRGGMVQTVSQYHFVYKLLYDYGCYLQQTRSSQSVQLQQQQQQQQTVSEASLNDTSETTDHDGHDSQASLII